MDTYINDYNKFIEQLKIIFNNDNIINILDLKILLSNEEKIKNGCLFSTLINEFDYESFHNSKIKIFSHKDKVTQEISESLFGFDCCLKNLINNQPNEVKNVIWKHLHNIWLSSENLKQDQNMENIKLMKKKLFAIDEFKMDFSKSDAKKKLQELLGVDVNNETSEMIDDIINSFEDLFNDSLSKNSNPMAKILKISQKISSKYTSKIKNGNIEISKIMEAIIGKLPGMENMFGKFKNMNKLFEKPKESQTIIIDENFSTANVLIGELPSDQGPSFKIGSMLKIADKFGIIPSLSNTTEGISVAIAGAGAEAEAEAEAEAGAGAGNLLSGLFSNQPGDNNLLNLNLDKMMGLVKNFQSLNEDSNNSDNLINIQKDMDGFLQNELGLDMNKINSELKNMISNEFTDKTN